MKFDYKNNKNINFVFQIVFIVFVFGFGVISFVFGKNFNIALGENKTTNLSNSITTNTAPVVKQEVIDEESAVINSVANSAESVVSIVISKNVPKYNTINTNPFGSDPFGFGQDFGFTQQVPTGETQKQEIGGGSGFIVSDDGLVVTNRHVVDDTTATYSVVLNNGKTYDLDVLARDSYNDIALCKIKDLKDKLKPLNLADSDNVKLGQTVIAIGNALAEYKNTVTKGIISGIGRKITAGDSYQGGSTETLEGILQTDAAINPGNSGGPLINLSGEVVGINTAVSSQGQNIGFAIPINSVKDDINSVIKNGKIVRPYIGIRYVQLDELSAKQNNLPYNYGIVVLRGSNPEDLAVVKDSPADKAGIKENDIILEINSVKLDSDHPFIKEISKLKPNDKIKLKIYRNSKIIDVDVTLGERDDK